MILLVSWCCTPPTSWLAKVLLAAMILNLAHCKSVSPGGSTTRTYVLFVSLDMMRLKRGALMTNSVKGLDVEGEFV